MNKELYNFAKECVNHYAIYTEMDDFYTLKVDDLPDFIQHEFAALIISHDKNYASEATGPDNQKWDTEMLPALIKYLKNSTDKDEAIEFNSIWRNCVTEYMNEKMTELLENALHQYNSDQGYTHSSNDSYKFNAHSSI